MAIGTPGSYTLFVDWDNDGDFDLAIEDVSAYLRFPLEWRRGRSGSSGLLDLVTAGKLRAVLSNTDDRFSQFNASSAIVSGGGTIRDGLKVQLRGGTGGGFPYTFPFVFPDSVLWTGRITRITALPKVKGLNRVVLEAAGPMADISERRIRLASQTSKRTDQLVTAILDGAGFSATDRDIKTGITTIARWRGGVNEVKALAAIRDIERTEGGLLLETKDGKLRFESRHTRLAGDHQTSQVTLSDGVGATYGYIGLREDDPRRQVFSRFSCFVRSYSTQSIATLWTHPETGAASPLIRPGESVLLVAHYPNPSSNAAGSEVAVWTTPVATTDVRFSSSTTDSNDIIGSLGIAASASGNAIAITLTNNGTVDGYVTALKARGTAVHELDPVRVEEVDSAVFEGRERTFPNPPIYISTTSEARSWALSHLSVYKNLIPLLAVNLHALKSEEVFLQVFTRDISDRITLTGTGAAGLQINEDFFIESEHHIVAAVNRHTVWWGLSPASSYSGFFVVGEAILGSSSRLTY